MKRKQPALVTIPNVPLLEAGVEYKIMTGKTTFTPEDLRDVVTAANEDPSIPSPRLKLGHVDPRYNDDTIFDGSPSFGMAKNLRLSENGMSVSCDFEGVPRWLAEIMPTAFPSRSIEGYWGVESQAGGQWRFVLSACALLGVVWPGINQLEDLPQLAAYYGETMPPDVQIISPVAASTQSTGGDPMGVAASANLDDVRRAFYTKYLPEHQEARWWWIRQVQTDPNELIVEDDETGQLYKLSFTSDDVGVVSFGDEAEPVRIDYIPDTRDAQKAAASHVAATLAIGRKVMASWNKREDSVLPVYASGGAMDPKEIRQRLGLPEDASDDEVQQKLLESHPALANQEPHVPGTAPHDPSATGGVRPVSTGVAEPSDDNAQPEEQPVLDPTAASAAGGRNMPPGMVMIDSATLDVLKVGASAAIEEKETRLRKEREDLVAAAIGLGQIAPSSREHWTKTLETADKIGDPSMRQSLASLPKGLIPVGQQIANGQLPQESGVQVLEDEVIDEVKLAWFPELRRERDHAATVAAGAAPRSRITADAHYRR